MRVRERSLATYKADELAIEGTGGAMTGHSKLDQMVNGDVLLLPLDCRSS